MTQDETGRAAMELRTRASVEDGIKYHQTRGPVDVIDYQPGNGTSYKAVLTVLEADASRPFGASEGCSVVVVALPYMGKGAAFQAERGGYLAWSHVGEKLDLRAPDAIVLAELFAHLWGMKAGDASCVVMP